MRFFLMQNYEKKFQHVFQVTHGWTKPERETMELIQAALSAVSLYHSYFSFKLFDKTTIAFLLTGV